MQYSLSEDRIDNLKKLATYLEKLPEDYEHFAMSTYLDYLGLTFMPYEYRTKYALENGGLSQFECHTVACAVGHGPSAGIKFRKGEIIRETGWYDIEEISLDWDRYSYRFAPENSLIWHWLFSGYWDAVDNTHRGAAARIRYTLDGGSIPIYGVRESYRSLYEKYLVRG